MDVHVEIRSVDPLTRKVRLKLHTVSESPAPQPVNGPLTPPVGARLQGRIVKATQERRGCGFVLLRLAGFEDGPLAMLHCTRMGEALRDELNSGRLATSDRPIPVQVLYTDPEHRRMQVAQPPSDPG